MIQQIILPYIKLNSIPKFVNKISFKKYENTTEIYIKKLQTENVADKLHVSSENELINSIKRSLCKKYDFDYKWRIFEYIELLHTNYADNSECVKNIICIGKYNNELIYSLNNVLNNSDINIKTYDTTHSWNDANTDIKSNENDAGQTDLTIFDASDTNVLKEKNVEMKSFLLHMPSILLKLKIGGDMIICLQDSYSLLSQDLLFYLNSIFRKVYISRPNIMITSDNHRYIICKHLSRDIKKDEIQILLLFFQYFIVALDKETNVNSSARIFGQDIPMFFKCKVDEINCIYGQQILEYTMMVVNNKQHELYNYYKIRNNKIESWLQNHKQYLDVEMEKIYNDQESVLLIRETMNEFLDKIDKDCN